MRPERARTFLAGKYKKRAKAQEHYQRTKRAVVLLKGDGGLGVLAGEYCEQKGKSKTKKPQQASAESALTDGGECVPGDRVGVGVDSGDVGAKSCDFSKWPAVNFDEVSCDEECE